MKRFSHFTDFNAEEFAANESFQSYVFKRSEDDIAFWQDFLFHHPEKRPDIQSAKELLTALRFKPGKTTRHIRQSELDRLLASLENSQKKEKKAGEKNLKFIPARNIGKVFLGMNFPRMAACMSGVLVIVAGFFFLKSRATSDSVTYQTGYGESATYVLPDSTVITLNGNSKIIHREGWDNETVREVWLEGEAFFDVKHKGASGNARFVVHTPGMDVEVLGTEFNVFNRKDRANVVLNSGRVKVSIASPKDTSTVLMMPNESLEFSRKDLTVSKKIVKAEMLTSWRNRVLVFENTPLSTVGEMIENTYGLEVIFKDNVDVTEGLAGTIPCENLDVLLDVLAKSSNLLITKQQDQIIIAKRDRESTKHQLKNNP